MASTAAAGTRGRSWCGCSPGTPRLGRWRVASRGYAGRGIGEVYPQLAVEETFVEPGEVDASGLDVAFVAYRAWESAGAVRELLEAGARLVVDLSADFRLVDVALYNEWYGEHPVAGALEGGALRVAGGLRGRRGAGWWRTQDVIRRRPMLALAPVVKRVEGSLRGDQRSLGGERGGGQAERQDALRLRQRERLALRAADGSLRHRHTPEIETVLRAGGGGARGDLRAAPAAHHARGAGDHRAWSLEDAARGARRCSAGTRRTTRGGRSWRRGRSPRTSRTWRTPTGAALGGGGQEGREALALRGGGQSVEGRLGGGGAEHEPGARVPGGRSGSST